MLKNAGLCLNWNEVNSLIKRMTEQQLIDSYLGALEVLEGILVTFEVKNDTQNELYFDAIVSCINEERKTEKNH